VELREKDVVDREAVETFLSRHNARWVARDGELVDALDQPAFLAWSDDELAGVATYVVGGRDCELLTLHVTDRFGGTGSALVAAVKEAAARAGCARLRVVTTNDNVDALRFYQRRGFRLARLRPGAVDENRRVLKPEIPVTGSHDIALRDEIELDLVLDHPGRD
jgi:ribosomal protein S18 acetylase RimI-like enzyme